MVRKCKSKSKMTNNCDRLYVLAMLGAGCKHMKTYITIQFHVGLWLKTIHFTGIL